MMRIQTELCAVQRAVCIVQCASHLHCSPNISTHIRTNSHRSKSVFPLWIRKYPELCRQTLKAFKIWYIFLLQIHPIIKCFGWECVCLYIYEYPFKSREIEKFTTTHFTIKRKNKTKQIKFTYRKSLSWRKNSVRFSLPNWMPSHDSGCLFKILRMSSLVIGTLTSGHSVKLPSAWLVTEKRCDKFDLKAWTFCVF